MQFEYWHRGDSHWSLERIRQWQFPRAEYNAAEDEMPDPTTILRYSYVPLPRDGLFQAIDELSESAANILESRYPVQLRNMFVKVLKSCAWMLTYVFAAWVTGTASSGASSGQLGPR